MARKATDLLDVFRFESDDDQDAKKRSKSASGGASASRKAKRRARSSASTGSSASSRSSASTKGAAKSSRRSSSDGIHLTSRQVLLASCAALLLLVLSFTLGLATGRPGAGHSGNATEGGPTLNREALNRQTMVMIRGSLPVVDPASRRPTDVARIRRTLHNEYDVPGEYLRIWKEGGRLILQLGPFRNEEQARNYLRRTSLDMAEINMEVPFFAPRYVASPK